MGNPAKWSELSGTECNQRLCVASKYMRDKVLPFLRRCLNALGDDGEPLSDNAIMAEVLRYWVINANTESPRLCRSLRCCPTASCATSRRPLAVSWSRSSSARCALPPPSRRHSPGGVGGGGGRAEGGGGWRWERGAQSYKRRCNRAHCGGAALR